MKIAKLAIIAREIFSIIPYLPRKIISATESAQRQIQIQVGTPGKTMCKTIAEPLSTPPTCSGLMSIMTSQSQIDQFPLPIFGPGNWFSASKVVSPEWIACFPNSSCTKTFTRQLTMMTQRATNPAFAPSVVVAMSSPDPTIEAERMKPGPR